MADARERAPREAPRRSAGSAGARPARGAADADAAPHRGAAGAAPERGLRAGARRLVDPGGRRLAEEVPAVLEPLGADWRGARGLDAARARVDAFVRHRDAHHAVPLFRNVSAEPGDRRYRRVRIQAVHPLIDALAGKVEEGRAAGRVARAIGPQAAAAALASILERLAVYRQELEALGVTRDTLVETCARILHQTMTGRAAA